MTEAPWLSFISKLRRITGHFHRTFLFLSSEILLMHSHDQPLRFSQTTNKTTTVLQERNLYLPNTWQWPKQAQRAESEHVLAWGWSLPAAASPHPILPEAAEFWGCWQDRSACFRLTLEDLVSYWKSWNCLSWFWQWFLWKVPASQEGAEVFSFLKKSSLTVTQWGMMVGDGKSGISRICAHIGRNKIAEIIPYLTLTLNSHALSVRLTVALLGILARSHIPGAILLPPKPMCCAGCSLTPHTPLS